MLRRTGARLAKGAAKSTGHGRATVFPTRAVSPKHIPPLATVRSFDLFFTIVTGRVAFLWKRRQWSSKCSTGSELARSGCQPVLQGNTPGDPHTTSLRVPCSVHCACSTNTTCKTNRRRQRPTWTKPFVCSYLFLACARRAPTCTCPSCAHSRHLPARALPMNASVSCLRVFVMLIFLAYC